MLKVYKIYEKRRGELSLGTEGTSPTKKLFRRYTKSILNSYFLV
jgi:hypothetical protein